MKYLIYASIAYLFVYLAALQYTKIQEQQARANAQQVWLDESNVKGVEFFNVDGKKVELEQFIGKPLLLNVWASWCAPCVAELPEMLELSKKHKDKFNFIAVSVDKDGFETITPFLEKHGLTEMVVFHDPDMKAHSALGVKSLPTSFVLDSSGKVVGRLTGIPAWGEAEFQKKMLNKMGVGLAQSEVIESGDTAEIK